MLNRYSYNFKTIAAVLAGVFLLQQVSYAAPFERQAVQVSALQGLVQDPSRFEVPANTSLLKQVHKGNQGKFIIVVQDAHSNLSGQENLAATLDDMMKRYGISLVLVEGGSRDVTLTPIKEVAPPSVWKKVAKTFLIEGKISGEEYLNLTSDHPMKILGIEDQDLYMQSLHAYANLAGKRQDILDYLKKIQYQIKRTKQKLYPQEPLDYEDK